MFVSASVTCFFAPKIDDPKRSGSLGVSFTIDKGVDVRLTDEGLKFNGKNIHIPTVEYVLKSLGYHGGVEVKSNLPLGCGFGLSGAIALASALEVNKRLGLNMSLLQLADLAHEAEVLNRTGLGDVVTQCYGGFVVRRRASCPSRCTIDRYPWDVELDFLVIGEIKTSEILEGSLKDVYRIGKKALREFLKKPSLENLFKVSKDFVVRCGFADDKIMNAIEAVESVGGFASMIMLGRGIFAYKGEVLREFKGMYFRSKVSMCSIGRS
jgi:pantoate kinase